MRGADHDVIRHAVEPGVGDRHPSVMRTGQGHRGDRIDRAVAGDDAGLIIDCGQQRAGRSIAAGNELLAGRAEERTIRGEVLQAVGDLATAVRRAQHHDATELRGAVSCEVRAGQQAAHRMTDEMHRAVEPFGETIDRRMNILGQRIERLAPAVIVEVEGGKAGIAERQLHPAKRARRPADAVQQDDAVGSGRRGTPFAHL